MTSSIIVALLVCLTVLVLAERARPLLIRLVKLQEYRAATDAAQRVPPSDPTPSIPPLPRDLSAQVDACTEGWERSDLVGAIREHYLEARPLVETDADAWIAVRQRLRATE